MTAPAKPPITLDLVWQGERRYAGRSGQAEIVLDGDGAAGPSPVQALAFALAGCMATDVVDIVLKGRHPLRALRARLVAERRSEPPTHFTAVTLHFVVTGDVPREPVERAIRLSREKYCSVWHSLRPDIAFTTSFEIERPPGARVAGGHLEPPPPEPSLGAPHRGTVSRPGRSLTRS